MRRWWGPYMDLSLETEQWQTSVVYHSTSPEWNEKHDFLAAWSQAVHGLTCLSHFWKIDLSQADRLHSCVLILCNATFATFCQSARICPVMRLAHTCSEWSLRIVKWNVSYVHKTAQSPEKIGQGVWRKTSCSFWMKVTNCSKTDCDNRTWKSPSCWNRQGGSRVSHGPSRRIKWKRSPSTCSWSDCISSPNISRFVGHRLMNGAVAPCKLL